MDALKKFLSKKKTDKVFKSAGPGHKLTESQPPQPQASSGRSRVTGQGQGLGGQRSASVTQSEEKKAAAEAALKRIEKNRKPEANAKDLLASRQLAYIREQARKEIEADNKKLQEDSGENSKRFEDEEPLVEPKIVDPSQYAVGGVFFTCPLIGPEVLSKREIEDSIREFLLDQPEEEIGVTSCLLIYSCNKPFDKVQSCVETLCKYLDNIVNNPNEPKFQRIRCSNKVFQEKVQVVLGAEEFLRASGFTKKMVQVDPSSSQEEEFWVFKPTDNSEEFVAHLIELRDTLKQTTPIRPEVDRNLQVLMPAEVKKRTELPSEFFTLSVDEIRRQQALKSELAERELKLRTKAMRERDELQEQRLYRYGLMRIRFPDGITLQGTFHALEKLSRLYDFVRENLVLDSIEFDLIRSGGESLKDMNSTLAEMRLPPSSILNFKVDKSPAPELASGEISYLKPEILALVKSME